MAPYTVRLSRRDRVLLLEDNVERIAWFKERLLYIDQRMRVVSTAEQAIAALEEAGTWDWIFLDHDLGPLRSDGSPGPEGNGMQVARRLTDPDFIGCNIVIHSWNPHGAAAMKDALGGAAAIPFGQFEIEFVD